MSDVLKTFFTLGLLFGLLLILIGLSGCGGKIDEYNAGNALIHNYPEGSNGDEIYRIRKNLELLNRQIAEHNYACAQAQMEYENE